MLLLQQHPSLPDTPLFNILNKLSAKAGFKIPKGAGAQVDVAAARLIKEKGNRGSSRLC